MSKIALHGSQRWTLLRAGESKLRESRSYDSCPEHYVLQGVCLLHAAKLQRFGI